MKKREAITFASVLFLLLNVFGCASVPQKDTSITGQAMLSPQSLARFSDIPVPANFKLLHQESYTFEGAGIRVAVLTYEGRANADQVVAFYKEQMPMFNWGLLNIIEYGNRLLNFDRDKENCVINLFPRGSKVKITISLGPKSTTAVRSSSKSLK